MSLIKLAVPGPGFAALQRIGLAEKALITHAGSDWLKNSASIKKAIIKPGIGPKIPENGLPVLPLKELNRFGPVNKWSKR